MNIQKKREQVIEVEIDEERRGPRQHPRYDPIASRIVVGFVILIVLLGLVIFAFRDTQGFRAFMQWVAVMAILTPFIYFLGKEGREWLKTIGAFLLPLSEARAKRIVPFGSEHAVVADTSRSRYEVTSLVQQRISNIYHHDSELTKAQAQAALPSPPLHIPTFAELLASGEIGPNQTDMLFNFQLLSDEITGQFVRISPIRGELGVQHTQFIAGGSQSGKTTYMSGNIGQAAAMRTLFYIIDPHKRHASKSLSSRVAAFNSYFILPPASTHNEIAHLLEHATMTRDALIAGKDVYPGYNIMVVVDEVPALMAYQKSNDKYLRRLYTDLALFMQSIGTQTAKFGMTGLYGSQFITKDELGEVEIIDACQSRLCLRLPPVQAKALGILGKEAVKEVPRLEKGHGYLMLSDSIEPLRVASGNVTSSALTHLAGMLPPSPLLSPVSPDRNADMLSETTSETARDAEIATILTPAFRVSEMTERVSTSASSVSAETKRTIARMAKDAIPHRKIAGYVGLSGEKYGTYQQVCRELGIVIKKAEEAS